MRFLFIFWWSFEINSVQMSEGIFPSSCLLKLQHLWNAGGNLQPASNDWLIFRIAKLIFDVLTFMIIFLFVLPIKKQSYIQNNMNLYNGWTTQNKVTELENSDNMNRKREGFDGISESIYLFILFILLSFYTFRNRSEGHKGEICSEMG